ncbi:MotE family protein [Fulvimarina sp. 2208YS6-2-32]|uniref:MotE family protein n=1 Tax=Fulvimarina uroteuthidis TaxID=3098149 RepID=A0ABU5I2B1_9HYPH|nr:MotE family protein [Fulvimarina sp. 2208YS6-2-32]MDY8108908.1 MotE family protein [Fulvimarina sp. 2208YS6-2-32]
MTARPSLRFLPHFAAAMTAGLIASGAALAAGAEEPTGPPPLQPQEVRIIDEATGAPKVEVIPPMSEVDSYCLNIADKAQDARHAMQSQQLKAVEAQITAKIGELEARRAEYQDWIKERKAFLEEASTIVVDIYAQMASDAAGPQLANLEREDAARILVRLKPRQASDVLSEMEPAVAAEIAKLIVEKTSKDRVEEGEAQTVAGNAS